MSDTFIPWFPIVQCTPEERSEAYQEIFGQDSAYRAPYSKVLKVKILSDDATCPTRGSIDSAGYDLYSAHDITIDAGDKGIVKTDIAVAIPQGCYGRIAPRSSLAVNNHIDVGAGVIDRDYRGNICVVLFNHSKTKELVITKGQRIAQLILERIAMADIQLVSDLDDTTRNQGGFGSTGTH